jgi:hypothetical protein
MQSLSHESGVSVGVGVAGGGLDLVVGFNFLHGEARLVSCRFHMGCISGMSAA